MSMTFALIVGNRDFFPDRLAKEGREEMLELLGGEGFRVVCPTPEDTNFGTVETWEEAKKCAELFKEHKEEIDGVIVTLPNFGDEKGVANTLRLSGLDVPVLVHAYPDRLVALDVANRRDSFCGKISVCNNLIQYGIPFSLTREHTVNPREKSFQADLHWFASVCRLMSGLKNLRLGAVGARPAAFNTVRFSEKILESYGISVETIDLSEIFASMDKLADADPAVQKKVDEIKSYCDTSHVPDEKVTVIAKFALVVEGWMEENDLSATAVQCWSSLERNLGIMPCTAMSMMSEKFLPSACEVDIMGVLAMYALQKASQSPSALVDWNNNYGDDPDRCVLFHCGNYAKSIFESVEMGYGDVISTSVGKENAYGSCTGRIKEGPLTYARFTTDDATGMLRSYVGEADLTRDPLDTFGGRGVAHIPRMQDLFQFICRQGFEHHVAINRSHVAGVFREAVETYLGAECYWHC